MTTTKTILTMAVIAALPFAATAENISGDMYTAPAHYDNNHPAPTTQADAPYGRANIDTADQEHIATTAYVKGAYNSSIAAVNKVNDNKQNKLVVTEGSNTESSGDILGYQSMDDIARQFIFSGDSNFSGVSSDNNLQSI